MLTGSLAILFCRAEMRRATALLRLVADAGSQPSARVAQPVELAALTWLRRDLHCTAGAYSPIHVEDEPYSRQRQQIVLGNRVPTTAPDTWLAPDALIIGDVDLFDRVSVWDGAVLRGDLNSIRVSAFSNIGTRTVIHAARTSPTGLSAATMIGRYVTIGQGCVLRSTTIGDESVVGDKCALVRGRVGEALTLCVLMEGSVVEPQSVLAPGSVVPPGALIPGGQLWSGVPARYIRDLTKDEKADLRSLAESVYPLVDQRKEMELPHSTAYREAESLRAKLAAASPQYAAMLAGWEDTEVTPEL